MSVLATSIQHCSGNSSTIRKEKEMKDIHIGKEEVELFQFADDKILYVKDPKESTKNYYN